MIYRYLAVKHLIVSDPGEYTIYVPVVMLVCCRYQFFLQLKQDLLTGRLECPYATSVEFAAAALQCKLHLGFRMIQIRAPSVADPQLPA
jgi:hypothetical protein